MRLFLLLFIGVFRRWKRDKLFAHDALLPRPKVDLFHLRDQSTVLLPNLGFLVYIKIWIYIKIKVYEIKGAFHNSNLHWVKWFICCLRGWLKRFVEWHFIWVNPSFSSKLMCKLAMDLVLFPFCIFPDTSVYSLLLLQNSYESISELSS